MEWYYAENNERQGPVTEAEFNELIRTGRITPATQVWRSGWESWMPLGESAAQPLAAGAAEAACAECRQIFPTSEMVHYEGAWVCPTCKPVFFQKVKEGIEPGRQMRYAGFWLRFLAKFLDGVIVGIPGYILQFGAMAIVGATTGTEPGSDSIAIIAMLIGWFVSFALQIAYNTWMLGKWGATVGKMACGLRVVTASGGKISYGLACGRFFAEMVSGLILYIGYIMAAFDDEKRTLHDRICNTRVIITRA